MFQKLFSMFFAYIIGFQLVVGAIPHHALSSSAWANSCSSGLQWNEMLGRCVTTAQAAELADASKMCESKGDNAAKKQCYRDVIDGKMKDANVAAPGKISMNMIPMVMAMASLASAVMFLMKGGPSDCPGATSAYLMIGGALAVVAGEIMSASKYKSQLKKAEEKFKAVSDSSKEGTSKTSSDNKTATSAQGEAFQAMIELEEATISAAKTKNMLYMVATAAYAAATVMSALEFFQYKVALTQLPNPPTAAVGAATISILTCKKAAAPTPSRFESPLLPSSPAQIYANQITTESIQLQQQSSTLELYVDNYFNKGQRVSYESYTSTDQLLNADNLTELSFINKEHINLKRGDKTGESYENYELFSQQINASFNVSSEEFSLMKLGSKIAQQFSISDSHAGMGDILPLAAMAAGVGVMTLVGEGKLMEKLYITPMSRMILAGVMTVNNIFMISKTNKEKSKAEERKKFIENLKAQVEAAGTEFGCASGDRDDLSKPNCYCYREGGGLNPGRVNSATCKNLFGGKPLLASNKANNPTAVSNQKNCVTNRGALDSSCSCRTSNTCVSVKSPSVVGNVPTGNVLGNLPQTVNGLNNGSLSAADINGAQFGALAARLNNMNDKLVNDPKNKALALEVKKAKAQGEKIMKDMERSLAGSALAAAPSTSGSLTNASSPAAALEEMKKELSQQVKGYEGNVVPIAGGGQGKKVDDFSLDALSGNGGVTVTDEQLADAANSLDMSAAEINSDSNANIFSILSNRYQRSGMRRLFGGETVIEADKPTGTDINQ